MRTGELHHERAGQWGGIASVLLLAFAVRLAVVLWLSDTYPYSDYYYYHQAGRLSAESWGLWFDPERVLKLAKLNWWPPGYPVFLGMLYEAFGPNHRVAAFAHVLLGTLVCGLTYAMARHAVDRRVALVAALIVAVDPHYVFMTNLLASENLFALWFALGLWLALRNWARRRDEIWTGIVLALATLTRAIAILLPVLVVVWKRRSAADARVWRRSALSMLAVFVLVILPWSIRNWVVVGDPALVSHGGGLNFYYGHNEQDPVFRDVSQTPMAGLRRPGEIDRLGWQLGLRHLFHDPLGEWGRGVFKLRELFASPRYALQANNAVRRPDGWRYDPAIAALAAEARERQRGRAKYLRSIFRPMADWHTRILWLGSLAALLFWRRFRPGLRFLTWIALYWVVAHLVFWAQPRFRHPLEMLMAILTSFALFSIAGVIRARLRRSQPQTEST